MNCASPFGVRGREKAGLSPDRWAVMRFEELCGRG